MADAGNHNSAMRGRLEEASGNARSLGNGTKEEVSNHPAESQQPSLQDLIDRIVGLVAPNVEAEQQNDSAKRGRGNQRSRYGRQRGGLQRRPVETEVPQSGSEALPNETIRRGGHSAGAKVERKRPSKPQSSVKPTMTKTSYSTVNTQATHALSAAQMLELVESGLSAMGSTESRQRFINDLAKERGLVQIRQIVETDFSVTYRVMQPLFYPHCALFLRLISQDNIRNSLVLERAVGTIYNVIYGHDGSKGIKFFQKLATCLLQAKQDKSAMNDEQFGDVFLDATKVLLSTLTLNQGASIKTAFRDVVNQLCDLYTAEDVNRDLAFRSADQNIFMIKDLLFTGDTVSSYAIPKSASATPSQPLQREDYPVDFPGSLAKNGPRHDNDHALISDIKILPTMSEILYDEGPGFLPTRHSFNVPHQHHETGVLRLLDSQFRLLREDTSGLLRDSVRVILENWDMLIEQGDWKSKRKVLRTCCPTPVRMYSGVEIQSIKPDSRRGLEVNLEFDQLSKARNLNSFRREQMWRKSRELREGSSVVALIDGEQEKVLFMLVSKRNVVSTDKQQPKEQEVFDLASNARRAMITLRLASDAHEMDLINLLHLARDDRWTPLILFEFPAVMYRSFEGVLRCLQSLHKNPSSIPLSAWLSPRARNNVIGGPAESIIVPAPPYMLNRTTFDLSCIPISSENTNINNALTFTLTKDPHILADELSNATILDSGQAVAMVHALRHEVALIQGPPGTGKSFVGLQIANCLLKNKSLLDLGPILCVCYTNHALDQFLNELLELGVKNIARLGSPSQFPQIEALSLDNIKKNKTNPRIPGFGRTFNVLKTALKDLEVEIDQMCKEVEKGNTIIVKTYLKKRFPKQARSLFPLGGEGQLLQSDDQAIDNWLLGDVPDWGNGEPSYDRLLLESIDIWTITNSDRALLYQNWLNSAVSELSQRLQAVMESYSSKKQELTALYHESDRQFLEQVDVLGITTTGLANNSDLLRGVHAKVLICEEAGEVLESHILTALLPSIQHMILIGDHLQLRPKISNLTLSMEWERRGGPKYNLDESLFERLANSRLSYSNEGDEDGECFPVAQLDHQRRMHPDIANLVRKTLYPALHDHPSTAVYPGVFGMKRRLFWLDHRNFEDADDPSEMMQSKSNLWEAQMVTALVRHLCRQGKYKPGEIAVLTPYLGQLRLLMELLGEVAELIIEEQDLLDLEDEEVEAAQRHVTKGKLSDRLRMATVDNFQGNEAAVVIVSLVRSNMHRNCGFLKTPNRINVLLSRAKHGMYIIGDASTSSHVPMWSSVINLLEEHSNIGPKLELQCSRHPENRVFVSSPEDFANHAPEGGCAETCGLKLKCGHSCTMKCHSGKLHKAVKCMKPCPKIQECGHPCTKLCHVPCGNCSEKVSNVLLPCDHTTTVECHARKTLSNIACKQIVLVKFSGCDHEVGKLCYKKEEDSKCLHTCDTLLPCGHACGRICSVCRRQEHDGTANINHDSCKTICGRNYSTCSHTCDKPCHPDTPCTPCKRPCEVRCKHSRCPSTCSEPCPPCAELCAWSCQHRRNSCNMPCGVPCSITPCSWRCEKKLRRCGHQCPGVCGETCPDSKYCQICCNEEVRGRLVDFLDFQRYGDINANEDPLIFLTCGHFYPISTLDGIMELEKYYAVDASAEGRLLGTAPKGCPECRMPLRNIDRYNRVIKQAFLDESTRRFVAHANVKCARLLEQVLQRETEIDGEREAILKHWSHVSSEGKDKDWVQTALGAYQVKSLRLLKQVKNFTKSVAKTEQPFGRVNSMFASARARGGDMTANAFVLDESMIQTGFQFRGQCLKFRLQWAILWDLGMINKKESIDSRICSALRDIVLAAVKPLLVECLAVKESCQKASLPQYQVEAMVFYVQFSLLSRTSTRISGNESDQAKEKSTRERERELLDECEALCLQYPGTLQHLKDDVSKARRLIDGGTFYDFVTTEEKRKVYQAMASQFSGTGHWYYCQNNHPFTVGECGMPMQQARCPECGAPVGGQNHESVEGVRLANDWESAFAG